MSIYQRGDGIRQLMESNVPGLKVPVQDPSNFSSRTHFTASSKVVEDAMSRHLLTMQKRALQNAKLEKEELHNYQQRVHADHARQISLQKQKEQLKQFLNLQKQERDLNRRIEDESSRALHNKDLELYHDEELVHAYPPMREVPQRVAKEKLKTQRKEIKRDLEDQMKSKSEKERRKDAESKDIDQRTLARLQYEKMEAEVRKQQNKQLFQENYVKQWEREIGVQKARKEQVQRNKEYEQERLLKEEKKKGAAPPQAYLPDRRVQLKNALTGDIYYPRPTHAALAIRALKNRKNSGKGDKQEVARTLSPISEPSMRKESQKVTRRLQSTETSDYDEQYESEFERLDTAQGTERKKDEEYRILKLETEPVRPKEVKSRQDKKMEEFLKKRAKKDGYLSQRIAQYQQKVETQMNETARTQFSRGSSTKRFYSVEKLKSAVKKSMGTGLFKQKEGEKQKSYLFRDLEQKSPSPEMKSPSPDMAKRTIVRKSVDIGRGQKRGNVKKHQRSHSDLMGGPQGKTVESARVMPSVEQEILQRELLRIKEREVEEKRIAREAEQKKKKEIKEERELEMRQKQKRDMHTKELKEQIGQERHKKKAEREHELRNPQNELFPKIEEPPLQETLEKHREKLKMQKQMLQEQQRNYVPIPEYNGGYGGMMEELWEKNERKKVVRREHNSLANEWKQEMQRKQVQKDAEKLALLTREPRVIAQYFQKLLPTPHSRHIDSPLPPSDRIRELSGSPVNRGSPTALPKVESPYPFKKQEVLSGRVEKSKLPRRGEWMRDDAQNKSMNAGLDKLELMSRISEKIDLRRKAMRLNETYDERRAEINKSMELQKGRYGRRGTSGAAMKEQQTNAKKRRESAKQYPWEMRQSSLRQKELFSKVA